MLWCNVLYLVTLLLGIIPSVKELNFEHTKVEPDDHILLLSDGVIEAENHKAEQFGEDRLYQSIADTEGNSPETHLVDIILSDLGDFVDGNIQKDDISLIDIPGSVTAEDIKPITPCGVELDVNESSILDIWNWNLELQGASLARINPVAQALSRLQESEGGGDQWHSVFSILTELYVNALDHGVLKLESSLKSSPEGFAEYFSEREKRLEALSKWCSCAIPATYAFCPWWPPFS